MAACHAYPFPVWARGSGLGPSSLFSGNILYKDWAGMRSAYSMLAFPMPATPARFWETPLPEPGLPPRHRAEEGDAPGTQLCPYFRGMFPFAKS